MSIITISRGSYSCGKEVAEKLATKLGYECVSRDIVLEACEEFNIPELKLIRALHDSPSVLERFQHGKERYLSYFRYSLLKHIQKDNVIYHGLAGHYLLRHIPNVFKVRITANMDYRVKEEMKREDISAKEALYILKKDDEERRTWGIHMYGTDSWDSRLYDMVLNINTLAVEQVVDVLTETVNKLKFKTTEESRGIIEQQLLTARIHSLLVQYSHKVKVDIQEGKVCISNIGGGIKTDSTLRERTEKLIREVQGVDEVVFVDPLKAKQDYINPYHNL